MCVRECLGGVWREIKDVNVSEGVCPVGCCRIILC